MSARGRLGRPRMLGTVRLPRRHRGAAWILAVAGPPLIALVLWPFRSTLELSGFLALALLGIVAVALIGGVGPALTAEVAGVTAGAIYSLSADRTVDVVALASFAVVAAVVGVMADSMRAERDAMALLAEEQAALRRVATLVARAAPGEELSAAVTEEAGQLLEADFARMGRYESDDTVTIVASWSRSADDFPVGSRWSLVGESTAALVARSGLSARMDDFAGVSGPLADDARERGVRSVAGAPIIVGGRIWGVMIAGATLAQSLPPDAETRLASFTDLLATAIANAESRGALAASRARVVSAADEARRRIERDLHDGAQQRLVSLGLELRAAQTRVPPQLDELHRELSHVVDGFTSLLDELREMARGIHPAILAEGGLGPALKSLERRSPIPVELNAHSVARLPERVEVATYYVVSETLTNAAKHARASLLQVDVEATGGFLRVCVRDDGVGGADPARGSGLVGLRDRVESLGGTIAVESTSGAGTAVTVALPISGEGD